MTPAPADLDQSERSVELRRIFRISILACILIAFSSALDGPVSITAWILLAAGFLCIVYVTVASHQLINRVTNGKVESQ